MMWAAGDCGGIGPRCRPGHFFALDAGTLSLDKSDWRRVAELQFIGRRRAHRRHKWTRHIEAHL